jgi:3-deoxy-D-manno-octulosonic-acid transferase
VGHPGCRAAFFGGSAPRVGLLVETEVWPNMVAACAQGHMPLCLVNARLSENRCSRRSAWPGWRVRVCRVARGVGADRLRTHARLAQLGAPVRGVLGNFKFDATPDAAQWPGGRAWRDPLGRPVLLFASSREGEELMLLAMFEAKSAICARVDVRKQLSKK